MTIKKITLLGFLVLSSTAWSQDELDELSFDELEAELDAEADPQGPGETSAKAPEPGSAQKVPPVQIDPKAQAADEELDDLLGENEFLDSPQNDEPTEAEILPAPMAKETKPEVARDQESAPPLDDLEAELEPEAPKVVEDVPPALRENAPEPEKLVQSSQDPSDLFYKIPVRPPMSDENWKKWAGPSLEKIYRIRKGDTLWKISERLFGNPYLWPKIWQLNANFGNPHEVEPNIELAFAPGLPNSAPELALRVEGEDQGMMSFVEMDPPLSLIDRLERILAYQKTSDHPPYKSFLVEKSPEAVMQLPRLPRSLERNMYQVGDTIQTQDLAPGTYSVVEVKSLRGDTRLRQAGFSGTIVTWVGTLEVAANGRAKITKAFAEIEAGATVIAENFSVSSLALRQEVVGPEISKATRLVAIQEGTLAGASSNSLLGVVWPDANSGAGPGAILSFSDDAGPQGYGLVVHRQGRTGTLWIIEGNREITARNLLD